MSAGRHPPPTSVTRRRLRHPGVVIVGSFGSLITFGTTLLALPVSHRGELAVSLGDAAFTATSAVTVTGLVVTDTRTVWSPFGETVIIVLIQLGGLGIMTVGVELGESDIRRRFGVTIVAIKPRSGRFTHAAADTTLQDGDLLVIAGSTEQVETFVRHNGDTDQ